jgi:hypothetical protein
LVEELLDGLVFEAELEQAHGFFLVGDDEADDGGIALEHRGVVLGGAGVGHYVEVQGFDVGEGEELLFGVGGDAAGVHEVALCDAVGFVEVARSC